MRYLYAVCFFLASFFTIYARADAPLIAPGIITKTSDFSPTISVIGHKFSDGHYYVSPAFQWFLVSEINKKEKKASYAIMFLNNYAGEWRFWNAAATDQAETLKTHPIKRSTSSCNKFTGCTHFELVVAELPADIVSRSEKYGLRIQFSGTPGTTPYEVIVTSSATSDQIEATQEAIKSLTDTPP